MLTVSSVALFFGKCLSVEIFATLFLIYTLLYTQLRQTKFIKFTVTDENLYLKRFLDPIKVCRRYKPKFGLGNREEGLDLAGFLSLYGSDPFYSWIGLNSDLMYAAHKAAGGMTSIYRQIGRGCESLFRQIIIDQANYDDPKDVLWSYTVQTRNNKERTLSLDARLELTAIQNYDVRERVTQWIANYSQSLDVPAPANGAVFEVRQGYKSKDSKRQNADIDNIAVAWANGYLPVFAIFSSQIDSDLVLRYRNSRGGIITGTLLGTSQNSLFVFSKNVLGYDLADFLHRNSSLIRDEIYTTLEALLRAE
ncbi:hypothetical protein PCC9214_03868 [Planktothrix tepida]|uniref:Uncharacterized protein n=1 Tax=Planktothrix tepida PCC 9214 TaxID=671072 RepID=A0A1J1LQI9_9CYAN|nr:hypothetical protein PCC9214_03868 [Planktothrix tepida]CUR34510.1 conserved hypothetical protein [Planktothrix tepida PCC 9214]